MARCSARGLLKRGWNPYIAGSRSTSNETKRIGINLFFWAQWLSQAAPGACLLKIARNAKKKKKQFNVKSSQVANPRNAFCIEQRAAAKSKEAQVRVFGLFLLLPRLAPVGLIAR